MTDDLVELTSAELEIVAGGWSFNINFNNFDSNQGVQAAVQNNNFDSNQGNQGIQVF
jgi:hypothetical protein